MGNSYSLGVSVPVWEGIEVLKVGAAMGGAPC